MKHQKITFILILSVLIMFSSCKPLLGGAGSKKPAEKTPPTTAAVLDDIFNTVIGKLPISQRNMVGEWKFQGTSCVFETDNFLKKAGGAVVAARVESRFDETCKSLNIKSSNTNFKFNADSTYTGRIGGVKISGKYLLEPKTKKVKMSYLLGAANLNATVVVTPKEMKLLFEADSILKLISFISQFTNISVVEALGKMADMYDGMLLGFDMRKH